MAGSRVCQDQGSRARLSVVGDQIGGGSPVEARGPVHGDAVPRSPVQISC